MAKSIKLPKIVRRLFYDPKQIPVLDPDGNIIEYKNNIAFPSTLKDSDSLRVKSSCAERGLSADRHNSVGYRKTLELLAQCKDLHGVSIQVMGNDDCSSMVTAKSFVESNSK